MGEERKIGLLPRRRDALCTNNRLFYVSPGAFQ
jgi:hypothetical protein